VSRHFDLVGCWPIQDKFLFGFLVQLSPPRAA
jgi:hypothetical protein